MSRNEAEDLTVRISFPSSIVGLDPVKDFPFHSSVAVMNLIYPPLFRTAGDPLNILESMETTDFKTYILKVKKDIRFQNDPCFPEGRGPILNAESVKAAFTRADSNTAIDSPVIERIKLIRTLKVKNSRTLVLELDKPDRWFSEVFAASELRVIPREALECYRDNIRFHPVGSGLYRLASWNEQGIVLIRNSHFKQNKISRLNQINLVFSKDKLADYNEFRKGSLDIIPLPPSLASQIVRFNPGTRDFDIKQTLAAPGFKIITGKNLQLLYCTLYSIRDPLVRRAVNFAVNRDKIRGGRTDWIPASGPLFNPDNPGFSYNLQKARYLLKQAGYPEQKGLKKLYTLHTSPGGVPIAEALRNDLGELGIDVEVINASWVGYQQKRKKDMDIAKFASLGPDPFGQLNIYQQPTFMIFNSRIDALTRQLGDDRQNHSLVQELTEEILQDPPLIYLFWLKHIYLSRPGISGIDPDWYGLSPYLDIDK